MGDKGLLMKRLRTALNMTQEELSGATGYSIQTISKLENGKGSDGVALNDILCFLILHADEEMLIEYDMPYFSNPIVPTDKVE